MRVAFGRCLLDTGSRELIVGGEPGRLSPKLFRLLDVLLESRPRAIAKSELHDRVWEGTYVSDAALSTLVAELRRAIGDGEHDAHLIRTVHGYGYALGGQVSVLEAVPAPGSGASRICQLFWNAREIRLCEGEHLIGRMRESVIWIDDPAVSRRHAKLVLTPGGVTLEDVGSKNGTYLNDRRIEAIQPINDGDRIAVGPARMVCRIFCSDGPTLTQAGEPR
jgi:DNA-binding winged helix-turn-helix (wHTH) protein